MLVHDMIESHGGRVTLMRVPGKAFHTSIYIFTYPGTLLETLYFSCLFTMNSGNMYQTLFCAGRGGIDVSSIALPSRSSLL